MTTGNAFRSDLYKIHNIIQSSMIVHPKEMVISVLRDFFAKDSYYHYVKDVWGFANTPDETGMALEAGLHDNNTTTRIFIGENYRYDVIFYPAILIKSGGSKYVPISINRESGGIQYQPIIFDDGYGNESTISVPKSFITAGAWEGSIVIDVFTRSLRSRDDLLELIGMCFTEIYFDVLYRAGIIVKPPSISGPSEQDDRNDKLFKGTVTLDIRTEWRREVPIETFIDAILFTVEFSDAQNPLLPIDPNFTINTVANKK